VSGLVVYWARIWPNDRAAEAEKLLAFSTPAEKTSRTCAEPDHIAEVPARAIDLKRYRLNRLELLPPPISRATVRQRQHFPSKLLAGRPNLRLVHAAAAEL
jgi:hypothetical protein